MDDIKPFWKTTVTVIGDDSAGNLTAMTVGVTAGSGEAPAVPFSAVVRKPVASFGDPSEVTATIVRVTAMNPVTGSITAMTRNQGGASNFPIVVGYEVYQYMGILLEQAQGQETYVGVGEYGATRAGFQAAIDARSALGGGDVIVPDGVTINLDPTTITPKSKVNIIAKAGSILNAPAGAVSGSMFTHTATISGAQLLASNCNRGATSCVLTAGGVVALGLAAGDLIRLRSPSSSRMQMLEVRSIVGDTINFHGQANHNFLTSDEVSKFTNVLSDCEIRLEGTVSAVGNSGVYSCVNLVGCKRVAVGVRNSLTFDQAPVIVITSGIEIKGLPSNDEGSGDTGYAVYQYSNCWGVDSHNQFSKANGFGHLYTFCGRVHARQTKATGGLIGRLFKADNCVYSLFEDCGGEGNTGPYSGVMLSGSATYAVDIIRPIGNGGGGYGVQSDGSGIRQVRIQNPIAENNAIADMLFANTDEVDVFNPVSATEKIFFLSKGLVRNAKFKKTTTGAVAGIIGALGNIPVYSEGTSLITGKVVARRTNITITVTIASPGVVTWANHGLANDTPIRIHTTGELPTGLATSVIPGITGKYTGTLYVRNATANTFELSLTAGGASINTSGSQSGVHTILATTDGAYYTFELMVRGDGSLGPQFAIQQGATAYSSIESNPAYAFTAIVVVGGLILTATGLTDHTTEWQATVDIDTVW